MIVYITAPLRARVWRASKRFPCSAAVRHGRLRVEVAFRTFCDHYTVYDADGRWLGNFSDVSIAGTIEFENIVSEPDVVFVFKEVRG
jgi:hypothetical protein